MPETEPGEEHQIDHSESDGAVEEPAPPAGKGVVELSQILVPDVTRGLFLVRPVAAGDRDEEDEAGGERQNRGDADVPGPEVADEFTHFVLLARPAAGSSSANGMRSASAKSRFARRLQAHTTMPTKQAAATRVKTFCISMGFTLTSAP